MEFSGVWILPFGTLAHEEHSIGPSDKYSGQTEQRTALLLEQLLQIARLSALEEMASGIAHELNQPIGAIATFAQPLSGCSIGRSHGAATSEVLQHISQEALNAGEGIRRIRSLFNGHAHGHTECDLGEVVTELMPMLDLLAQRRGASQARDERKLPNVAIDRLRIQHVLFALVQNALEAPTAQGEPPSVAIEMTGDRYGVQVAVRDRGVGVPDSAQRAAVPSVLHHQATWHGAGLGVEPGDRRSPRRIHGFRE